VDLGCARDCIRFPSLGFELRVFQTLPPALEDAELDGDHSKFGEKSATQNTNEKGDVEVVNGNSAIKTDSGLGNTAKTVVLSESKGDSGRWVAMVNKIYPTSPAERAGLHVGGE
jgi:hypothetical protein